jgi:hypothetical protein
MQKTRILLVSLLLNAALSLPLPGSSQAQTQQPPPLTDSPRDAAASAARQAALPPPASVTNSVGPNEAARRAQALTRSAPVAATRSPAQRQQAQTPRALIPQNRRLGVNFANYYINGNGPRAYAQMRAAGVKHERITFNMNAIEPANNTFTWDAHDALITDATAQDIEVLGVLIMPSDFAKQPCPNDVDGNPNNNDNNPFGVPTNLNLPWSDPDNHWAQFIYATVSRYKDSVRAWEVWNEPNFRSFWCTLPDEGPRFAQMTRVSYQAIKAADPTATVVLAPMYRGVEIGRIATFFESLRDLPGAVANNYYHDVIGFHLYDGGHCSQFDELGFLDATYFRPNVGAKPIWNTESGIRVRDDGWPEFATSEESAYFAVTNAAYSWHKNVGRYYYFRAIDEQAIVTPDGHRQGLGTAAVQRHAAPVLHRLSDHRAVSARDV